jgi:hypothetical protein
MPDRDRLSSLILEHWSRCHPRMLEQFRREDCLETELERTAQRFTDLLHDLVSVSGMEYHQAWELATGEILLPEESSSTQSPCPRAISA